MGALWMCDTHRDPEIPIGDRDRRKTSLGRGTIKMREIGNKDGVSLPVGMSRLASLLAWCVDYSMAMIGVYGVDKHSHEPHNLLLEIVSTYNIYIYIFYNPKPH